MLQKIALFLKNSFLRNLYLSLTHNKKAQVADIKYLTKDRDSLRLFAHCPSLLVAIPHLE